MALRGIGHVHITRQGALRQCRPTEPYTCRRGQRSGRYLGLASKVLTGRNQGDGTGSAVP
jgi:hypothetical protein